jgi:hypothetical protein
MVTPPLSGYPVDRRIIQRMERERHARRVRKRARTAVARVARLLNDVDLAEPTAGRDSPERAMASVRRGE